MPDQPTEPFERETADTMAAQFRAARETAQRQFRLYRRQIAEELARNVEEAFSPAPATEPPALAEAPVADLHRLEQADSRVRHSIVQACFYNLRLYSALLPDRREKPGFREKLLGNLAHLPGIEADLERYFAVPVGGLPAGAYFPQHRAEVLGDLSALGRLTAALQARYDDPTAARRFAEEAPGHIDRIMTALGEITARLREIKTDLVALLEEQMALHGDRLAAAGISLRFTNKNGESAPIFGRRRDLMSAFWPTCRRSDPA
jgi:hypothetical protein